MNVTHGMNLAQVEDLARLLDRKANELEQIVSSLNHVVYGHAWEGYDGARFRDRSWPTLRSRLSATAQQLHASAAAARRNANEQREASAAGGADVLSPLRNLGPGGLAPKDWHPVRTLGTGGSGPILGPLPWTIDLRDTIDSAGPFGTMLSELGHQGHLPFAAGAGKVIGHAGYAASGYTIAEDVANGHYRDAAFETAFTGGDIVSDRLKQSGTPTGYAAGVATQTWTEVAREARNVDWSAKGLHDIQSASMSDWAGALGEAFTKMPNKLIKIFSFG
jgi:hypothetical protein